MNKLSNGTFGYYDHFVRLTNQEQLLFKNWFLNSEFWAPGYYLRAVVIRTRICVRYTMNCNSEIGFYKMSILQILMLFILLKTLLVALNSFSAIWEVLFYLSFVQLYHKSRITCHIIIFQEMHIFKAKKGFWTRNLLLKGNFLAAGRITWWSRSHFSHGSHLPILEQ